MSEKPKLKQILPQLQSWCAVNNVSVQSVYDECHGMTLTDTVYYLFGVVKQASEEVVDYEGQFEELYNYVHEYFDNLDVQEEINKKLNEMADDGSLAEILTPIILSTLPPLAVDNTEEMTNPNRLYILKSNSHLYQYLNNEWQDTGVVYGGTIGNVINYNGAISDGSDFNSVIENSVYAIKTYVGGNYTNYPTFFNNITQSGYLLTIGSSLSKIQILKLNNNLSCIRVLNNGMWTPWRLNTNYIETLSQNSDLDALEINSVYHLSLYSSGNYVNYPEVMKTNNVSGFIHTVGFENIVMQEIKFENGVSFTRFKSYETWLEWNNNNNYIGSLPNQTDFNEIDKNTIYIVSSQPSGNYLNYPTMLSDLRQSGYIITIGSNRNKRQLLELNNGIRAIRSCINNTWTIWRLYSNYIGTLTPGSDLNNLSIETSYRLSIFRVGNYLNYPDPMKIGSNSGLIITNGFENNITQMIFYENGVCYIRFKSGANWTNWETKDSVSSDNAPLNVNAAYAEKSNPYATIKDFNGTGARIKIFDDSYYAIRQYKLINYPCFTVIDDDTSSLELVEYFHNVCASNNIIGNYACLTGREDVSIYDKLKEYEFEGYNILLHSLTQNKGYLNERTQEVLNDFLNGYHKFKEYGFIDTKLWVTPYGSTIKSIVELAPMFGFLGCFTTANVRPNMPNSMEYSVQRINIGPSSTGVAYNDLEWHKTVIDNFSPANPWFVYTTHVNAWNGDPNGTYQNLFKGVMDYLKEKGARNVNASCGFHMFKYQWNNNIFTN